MRLARNRVLSFMYIYYIGVKFFMRRNRLENLFFIKKSLNKCLICMKL